MKKFLKSRKFEVRSQKWISVFRLFSVFGLLTFLSLLSCQKSQLHHLQGATMGTTYSIKYISRHDEQQQNKTDSLLEAVNLSLSTYLPNSTISVFNQSLYSAPADEHFINVFKKAKEVYGKTNGAFDPTVMPLVNYWGFGYADKKIKIKIDSSRVDSLRQLVRFNQVRLDSANNEAEKEIPGIQLDFSALAKGYGVDVIANFLKERGINNFLVEIGGEVSASGKNDKNMRWKVGIDKPLDTLAEREFEATVRLKNKALATSGNYRNFYEQEGKKIVHTINPKTGYPEVSNLLSASVLAEDCMTADAYATAFMVMGLDKAVALSGQLHNLEVLFIYSDTTTGKLRMYASPGMEKAMDQ